MVMPAWRAIIESRIRPTRNRVDRQILCCFKSLRREGPSRLGSASFQAEAGQFVARVSVKGVSPAGRLLIFTTSQRSLLPSQKHHKTTLLAERHRKDFCYVKALSVALSRSGYETAR